MIDTKKLNSLKSAEQLELIRVMTEVARMALLMAKDESPEVRAPLIEYAATAEDMLEKASWSLR